MLKMFNAGLLCLLFCFSLVSLLLPLFTLPASAQGVYEAWVARYNGSGNGQDAAYALVVDASGNVYVTGRSIGSGTGEDYATIKYSSFGDTLWVRRYNGPGNGTDYAQALAVDDDGNEYVTGNSVGIGTFSDFATIKYAPNGDTVWVRRYNGPGNGNDDAHALAVDDNGNVYVAGGGVQDSAHSPYCDFITIKYSPAGDTLWVRTYNGPSNGDEYVLAMAVDANGNVYVTGDSWGGVTLHDYATIKYAPNGDSLWVRRYNGPGNGEDVAYALAVDDSGNVYVTGYSEGSGTSYDYTTIKYSPNGDTLWVRRYNGPGNSDDAAGELAVDDSGNVYVTGYSYSGAYSDYATIKYSSLGDTLWVRRYNGPGNSIDRASDLVVDGSGNLYVTGSSDGSGTFKDYATVKYSSAGDTLWVRRYNGPGNDYDYAYALAVDGSGNLYVSGISDEDYATIKYSCAFKPGDANGDGLVRLSDIVGIINYLFKDSPVPEPLCRGDADGDGSIVLPDIIYLINFLFKSGPAPVKSAACCL